MTPSEFGRHILKFRLEEPERYKSMSNKEIVDYLVGLYGPLEEPTHNKPFGHHIRLKKKRKHG